MTGSVDKDQFVRELCGWFREKGRDLPWRRTCDPYGILVSEVMLQQTTVAAVVPYYERWMQRFPRVHDLAMADEGEVLAMWQGLGYYRRARNLHAAARVIVAEWGGKIEPEYEALRRLPGVGDYTANAVLAFAFDEVVPVLDANIVRVVARLFDISEAVDSAEGLRRIREALAEILPQCGGRKFASAMMELGALVCRAGEPECSVCVVRRMCAAKVPSLLPKKKAKPALKRRVEYAAWIGDDETVMLERSDGRRWHGLWHLPYVADVFEESVIEEVVYSIVRERVALRVVRRNKRDVTEGGGERREFRWVELESVGMPSPHRRIVRKLMEGMD